MKAENSERREMDTSGARKRGRSLAQRLMDSGANLTVGGSSHVGLFFWWRWPTLPHKRLPRAAEYCIGCLKGLLQRRENILQREKEREVDMRGGGYRGRGRVGWETRGE